MPCSSECVGFPQTCCIAACRQAFELCLPWRCVAVSHSAVLHPSFACWASSRGPAICSLQIDTRQPSAQQSQHTAAHGAAPADAAGQADGAASGSSAASAQETLERQATADGEEACQLQVPIGCRCMMHQAATTVCSLWSMLGTHHGWTGSGLHSFRYRTTQAALASALPPTHISSGQPVPKGA